MKPIGEPFDAIAARMTALFLGVSPAVVAHDLDPDHPASRWARTRSNARGVAVQRHHASVVSVMAEHGIRGPVIGLAFDGGGRGADGTWWGGEILFADHEGYRRVGTFRPLRMAGGSRVVREPWRMALALLEDSFGRGVPEEMIRRRLPGLDANDRDAARTMIARGEGAPSTHALGRLLDGMAALGLRRGRSAYDGQLADEWAAQADPSERRGYPCTLDDSGSPWSIDLRSAVRVGVQELLRERSTGTVAAKFQNTIARAVIEVVQRARAEIGPVPVVLSGACFQNRLFTEMLVAEIAEDGPLFLPVECPTDDSSIAFGQAVVANALLLQERESISEGASA